MKQKSTENTQPQPAKTREDRLKAALKANLRRRKVQSNARADTQAKKD